MSDPFPRWLFCNRPDISDTASARPQDGFITREEFVKASFRVCPLIKQREALQVFDIEALDEPNSEDERSHQECLAFIHEVELRNALRGGERMLKAARVAQAREAKRLQREKQAAEHAALKLKLQMEKQKKAKEKKWKRQQSRKDGTNEEEEDEELKHGD